MDVNVGVDVDVIRDVGGVIWLAIQPGRLVIYPVIFASRIASKEAVPLGKAKKEQCFAEPVKNEVVSFVLGNAIRGRNLAGGL